MASFCCSAPFSARGSPTKQGTRDISRLGRPWLQPPFISHKWPKTFATPLSPHPGPTGPAIHAGPLDPINLWSAVLSPPMSRPGG